jgi:hypothetical protein
MIGDQIKNGTHVHMMKSEDVAECYHKSLPNDETRFSLMANFFTSNGFRGEVITKYI